MADTTSTTSAINPPSSSLKLYYRVARFAWENGEQYLCFTSDHYFRLPSSHIYETSFLVMPTSSTSRTPTNPSTGAYTMNYNTNRTIQAVCAKAIIYQIYYSQGSCFSIEMAAEIAWLGFEYADKIQKDYRLHSGAYASQYGFFPFSIIEWTELPVGAKQTYRLEMLYYFWLANQDGMDAFS